MTATDDIEERAVDRVSDYFLYELAETKANINSGDRGVSFDGEIVLFSSGERTKDTYRSSIPVQVKGTEVGHYSDTTASFSKFEISEFKNFQRADGVLVFLVELIKGDRSRDNGKIFWSFLDVQRLEEIVTEQQKKGTLTHTIHLQELPDSETFIQEMKKIAVQRKVVNYGLVKYSQILRGQSGNEDEFSVKVVNGIKTQIQDTEYLDPKSQFNIRLKKDFENALGKLPEVDSIRISVLANQLKSITNSGHSLPVEFQIYVHGIKTVMGLLERDDALIQKEVKILEGSDDQFGWVEIIVYWCKRILISDYVNTTIESSVRAKVDALCALRKSEDVKFVELRNSFDDGSAIWKRMNADFMSDVDPARSVKDYQELNHVSVNFQTRIKEYALRWSALLSQGVNRSIDEIDALLVDINTFQDSLLEQFNAKSPDVERIQFELQTFINPQDGISQIRELVDREGSMDKSYLLTLEMQLLLEQGKLEPAIELFDTFDDEEITPHSVILIFKAFMQNKAWSSILQLMKHFGTSAKNSPNLAHLQNIGVEILCDQSFLDSAISMDTLTTFLNDSIDFNMLNVRALLSVIRVFQNANQLKDESFEELIVKRLAMNTSLRDVYALWETLPVINLVHLADITFPYMYFICPRKALEATCAVLINNSQYQLAEKFSDELSVETNPNLILQIKSKILWGQEQYRALTNLYLQYPLGPEEYLHLVMLAYSETQDSNSATSLAKKLISSSRSNIRINAALTLIKFRSEIGISIKILEREILESSFSDDQLNMVYTGAMLALGDKNNDIKAADLEDQWELKHLVLSLKDSEREVLLVPAEWQISNVLNLEVMSEKSELGIITAGLGAHDKIPSMNGGDEDESIVLSEPLSVYILHESLRRESGGMNSDKPMKMFKIGQDMSEFFDAVKKFDNSERIKLVTQQVSEFNSFMIFGAALSPGDIMKAIYEVFDNQNIHYVAGNEGTYSDDKRYVLSLSSIIFLEWLGLLPVLKLHSNILISANLKGWLQSLVKAELSSTSVGRLIVVDGKVSMVKESPETRKPTVDRYKRMLVAIDDLPEISVSTIDPKIRQIEKLDVESVQLAIDKKAVLLTEDSAWQTIVHSDFHTFAGMSSMTLIGNEVTIDSTQSKKYAESMEKAFSHNTGWHPAEATVSRGTLFRHPFVTLFRPETTLFRRTNVTFLIFNLVIRQIIPSVGLEY